MCLSAVGEGSALQVHLLVVVVVVCSDNASSYCALSIVFLDIGNSMMDLS